jgi:AcrR family transcriptional regulator
MATDRPTSASVSIKERPNRSGETETAILEAARDLLAEGGVDALSMRMVADRVGLSATAIYHHFAGKQDLVKRVVETGYQRFEEYGCEVMKSYPRGSLELLIALGEGYVRFAFENQAYFRVLFNIQRDPRDVEELPAGGGYHVLRQCVLEAMENGAIRQADPDLVAHYLWTNVHGLVTLILACNIQKCDCAAEVTLGSPVELYRAFTTFLTDGLRPPPSDSRKTQ